MGALLTWLASFITGPLLQSGVDAWKAKLQSDNDKDKIAADLAGRELIVQQREIEVQAQLRTAEIGHPFEPDKIMGYCVAVYLAKLLIWDKVLGLGTTDPLVGWVETTANLIVAFYFGKRGFENVARILKRK